jgi:hypothetical protein
MVALALGTGVDADGRRRPAPAGAPVPLAPPRLVGSGRIGEGVAADPGAWRGAPALGVQWTLNGADIPGATLWTYFPASADDRGLLAVRITATNAAGSGEAVSDGLPVTWPAPSAAGGSRDLILFQTPGFQLVNAFPDFTGEGLSFSVAGEGVSVDPATGVLRISTDALRDGVEVSVTATNSGGSATTRFRLSVIAAEPALKRPEPMAPPRLSGTGRIGEAVELDPGVWDGTPAPEIAVEWRRDGAGIAGAAGLAYVPGPEDDLADLTACVTARNAAGSAQAETGPLAIIRPAPAVAAGLADLALIQGAGEVRVEAAAAFVGAGLVYAVTGAGARVDAATGSVAIPTDALLEAAEVTVSATNSGGSAAVAFRVSVAAAPKAPVLVTVPSLAGTGKVDSEVVVDPGVWAGVPAPELAVQWLRDGAAIEGATATAYVPGAADDRTTLSARVTARNAAGSAEAETAALPVTRVAPVSGRLDDLDLVLGSGPREVEAAAAFAGQGLAYAVTGAGASVDAATGRVSIPTDAVLAGAEVTVTARNSGGEAAASFRVTVAIAWPADVTAGLWQVTEITDADEAAAAGYAGQSGHLKAVFGAVDPAPAGFTLRHDIRGAATPNPVPQLPQVPAGTTVITAGVVPVGDTAYPRLYWRHTATDTFKIAGEHVPVVVQGLTVKAPVAVGALPDEVFDQGTGVQSVPTAFVFQGAALRYSVTGAGASIDAATGVVSVPTATAVDGARVTVTASNSGGSVTLSFLVTVEAEVPAPGGLPLQPQTQVNDAISRSLMESTGYRAAEVSSSHNPKFVVLALASYSGNATADSRLLQHIRNIITGGKEPGMGGGYNLQHHCHQMTGFAIAKATPRIWSALTSAEKSRVDLLMRAASVGCAFQSGVNNVEIKAGTARIACLYGDEVFWKTGSVNFRMAPLVGMLACRAYFGSTSAVLNFLESYDHATFTAQLQAAGFTNAYNAFRSNGPAGHFPRPTAAQVNTGVRGWAFALASGAPIKLSDAEGLLIHLLDLTFNRTIAAGLNNGAGIIVNGTAWGRIINGAANLPNLGQSGMINEFDSQDGGGPRSGAHYATLDYRLFILITVLNAVFGWVPRNATGWQSRLAKIKRGIIDYKYKSDNGYRSYDHGAPQEVWTSTNYSSSWAWLYGFGVWFDVLEPWLDGK